MNDYVYNRVSRETTAIRQKLSTILCTLAGREVPYTLVIFTTPWPIGLTNIEPEHAAVPFMLDAPACFWVADPAADNEAARLPRSGDDQLAINIRRIAQMLAEQVAGFAQQRVPLLLVYEAGEHGRVAWYEAGDGASPNTEALQWVCGRWLGEEQV